jgi:recombinational DNA repair protein RecR
VRSKSITAAPAIEALFAVLSKAPGLGSRSARRTALQVLKKKDQSTADRAR